MTGSSNAYAAFRADRRIVHGAAVATREGGAAALAGKRAADLIAAESQETTTQASNRIPHPVSLANGHSLMVPLIARSLPADRLSLFQPATQPKHPLASIRLTNDSGAALPPGVLTLYERGAKVADQRGDRQAAKEMQVFSKRLRSAASKAAKGSSSD